MPRPDARETLRGLIGRPLGTPARGAVNTVLDLEGSTVRVATADNPTGAHVDIALVQDALDRIWAGEEVVFDPRRRSAFVGAVLATIPGVEVLTDPRRARLRSTGDTIRSPSWEPDELVLALDLYLRWRPKQPSAGHPDLQALSSLLRQLPIHSPTARPLDFRSPGSVRRKLGDFTAADPDHLGAPTKGGTTLHHVWAEYAEAPDALAAAVRIVTAAATDAATPPRDDDETGVIEGRLVFRQHRVRERNPVVVNAKKAAVRKATGRLACEVCDVDFTERYGPIGKGFIEAHHTVQLALGAERTTRTEDLALVCANCHRMIHRGRPILTVAQLRDSMAAAAIG